MSNAAAIRIRFWGVRGSHPAPGSSTVKVGGNSSCVEIETPRHTLVFDAGTGLIGLGRELLKRSAPTAVHIFISHTHHDHIEGLRFFEPAYRPEWQCHVYGPGWAADSLHQILSAAMEPRFFPVSLAELPARVQIRDLNAGEDVRLNSRPPVRVAVCHSRAHPKDGIYLYRVHCAGRSVVYATDVEVAKGGRRDVIGFARGVDVLIHDAQYTEEEYFGGHLNKSGWGHSTVRQAAEVARDAGVGQLLLYHHDPSHDDAFVGRLERLARSIFPKSRAAREGMSVELRGR